MPRFPPPLLLFVLLLAGCGPIVQIGGLQPPPQAQYVLAAPATEAVPAGVAPIDPARAVSVLALNAPSTLATIRIPVKTEATEVRYLKGAEWAEPPARMMARLIEVRLAGAGIPVIDRRVTGRSAPQLLGGTLRAFEVDAADGSQSVRVRLDATLAGPGGTRLRSFERDLPLTRIDGPDAARALNAAANQVAEDVAQWVAAASAGNGAPAAGSGGGI